MPLANGNDPLLKPGRVIGGCRVVRELKRGGMGCVYLAEHLTLRCPVALKTILPFHDDDRGRRLFFREARLCARIDHPNVVVIHDAGEADGVPYIIMRYVDGKNLTEYLQEYGSPLPWKTVLNVSRSVVRGLMIVHRRGLVHRDIKPSNIMVSFEGRVLLMDFGLVRDSSEASHSASTGVIGTPQFMSPEQCAGVPLDGRSDIFSLGASLYYLLTATPPFGRGEPMAVLHRILAHQAPRPVNLVNPNVPQAVSDMVARCMAFDPTHRFQTAEDLHRVMREILQQLARRPESPAEPLSTTVGSSSSLGELCPSLAPLELVSLESSELTPVSGRTGWIVLAMLACFALLGLVLAAQGPGPEPKKEPAPPGMIKIESGNVQVGAERARIDQYINKVKELDPELAQLLIPDECLEGPRVVAVDKFCIDKYEVTNQQYLRFVQETHRARPRAWPDGQPAIGTQDHPVVGITRADAEAYAHWLGKELPTVAQWMMAFHGQKPTLFPWGDEWDPELTITRENKRYLSTIWPVTETPRDQSWCGVRNLVGNASELTRDTVPYNGVHFAIAKGGNCSSFGRLTGISAYRTILAMDVTADNIGFRCVYERKPLGFPKP
jgi:serine/threonine protein kinase